jgi:hypothetical protein
MADIWLKVSRTHGKLWRTYGKIWRTYGKLWRTYGNFTSFALSDIWENMADIWENMTGERTCPDTPNRKYPDIVLKGNITTKLHNRKYPDTKKGCRDISCWAIGNITTQFWPTGNVPTAKNIVGIFPVEQ